MFRRLVAESAVVNLALRVLRQVDAGARADAALRDELKRTRHRSAPAERRAVTAAVFRFFRWRLWLDPRNSLAQQLDYAGILQARFERDPALIKPEALAAQAVPDWTAAAIPWPELAADPSAPRPVATELAWLRQLQREPALWIRARRGCARAVAQSLGHCAAADFPGLDSSFRFTGSADLFSTPSFQSGQFEIQDLASQVVGLACNPQPGETWWDACAGEGGKTLHLADRMENRGLIWASDRSDRRLATLKERAARAQMFNYRAAPWDGGARLPTRTKFNGVLVDAPCSGIGTWQRNPHARWTTGPNDVRELAEVQLRLLGHVASAVKPGGRLVYAVCTLARSETMDVTESFGRAHPEFTPAPLAEIGKKEPAAFLWPQDLNANGMFIAKWVRQ